MTQENPTLKFTRLTDTAVLEQLNNLAVDSQWDVNNAKSPKSKRDAQDNLNLYASAVESIKQQQKNGTDPAPIRNDNPEREQAGE